MPPEKASGRTALAGNEVRGKLEKAWGIELTPSEMYALTQDRFSVSLEEGLTKMIQSVMAVGVVGNKLTLMSEHQQGIVVRKLRSGREWLVKDVERFPDLNEARDRLEKQAAYLLTGARGGMRPVSITLAQKLVVPNLSFNRMETDRRRGIAVQQTRPVFFQIKKGETIVRAGEKIDEAVLHQNSTPVQKTAGTRDLPDLVRPGPALGTIRLYVFSSGGGQPEAQPE